MLNIETFMQQKVEADTSYNFQKLYAPFWFIVYYIIGYPLRVLGCFADGFVIYGLVYAARESTWQSLIIAFFGAIIIQIMLGESATITAKNLFRGLFYRSLAYGMMLLVTLIFTGGSLYSTIFLSKKGSIHVIESVSPTLQSTSLEKDKNYNNELIKSKESKHNLELETIKSEAKTGQDEVKKQVAKIEKLITNKQRIVNNYTNEIDAPWEHREAIIKGQRQLITLNTNLTNLVKQEKIDLANARKQHGKLIVFAEQSKQTDVNSTIAANTRKQEKLALFGFIAMGANVGINILSFLIIWGFELYLKFAQGGGIIKKTTKKKQLNDDNNEDETPNQSSETTSNTESEIQNSSKKAVEIENKIEPKSAEKIETFEPQRFANDSEKSDSKTTVLRLETQFFPYEKHVKNARQSFKRAFDNTRKSKTIQNRMATAQQHINALLSNGFNVWVDENYSYLLRFDKLKKPTLEQNNWKAVVKINENCSPVLQKYELEKSVLANVG